MHDIVALLQTCERSTSRAVRLCFAPWPDGTVVMTYVFDSGVDDSLKDPVLAVSADCNAAVNRRVLLIQRREFDELNISL